MISTLPYDVAYTRFEETEQFLKKKYPEAKLVNPMKKWLPRHLKWQHHMIVDLMLLSSCTDLFQMEGWEKSHGAQIENLWAKHLGITTIREKEIEI